MSRNIVNVRELIIPYLKSISSDQLAQAIQDWTAQDKLFLSLPIFADIVYKGTPPLLSLPMVIEYAIESDRWDIVSKLLDIELSWSKLDQRKFLKVAAVKQAQTCFQQLLQMWGPNLDDREWTDLTRAIAHWGSADWFDLISSFRNHLRTQEFITSHLTLADRGNPGSFVTDYLAHNDKPEEFVPVRYQSMLRQEE